MRQRILTALIALTVVTTGFAGVGAAEIGTETEPAQSAAAASVTFANQTTGGDTVTVDSVTLPNGGYVTVHDASLADGNVLGSVAGTSAYLSPGTHENVTVALTDPVEDGAFFAMAHRETDGDRTYEFVASNGQTDGPYTMDGDIVMNRASLTVSASVSMTDQPTTGESVVVDRVVLSDGGFVTIHDATVTEGAVFESIRGTSTYLDAGVHEDVRVELSTPVENDTTLVPMAHRNTDDDQTYTFPESEGNTDGPYLNDGGSAVVDTASVMVTETAQASIAEQTTGGHSAVVESVLVPEGGFVTVHDETLADGAVFDSVRGTSMYLEPGLHQNVVVTLDRPVTNDTSLVAMPHRDTDGDETYDFVTSSGDDDGPYTADGGAVTDAANVTVAASVSMTDQSSDGTTIVVDRVDLAEGGFVAIHDATLFDGAVFDSVVGHSTYLEAGVHENVEITLDERLQSGQTLVAMPHRDTDGDTNYTFVEIEGDTDGPYTADGGAVVDTAAMTIEASLDFEAQTTDGETVTVRSVTLQDGGFVTIHDATVTEGAVFESIRGTSSYLAPGTHENVTVTLSEPLTEDTTLVPMAHRDTDGDETYTFPESEGATDAPYTANGGAVVAVEDVSVEMSSMENEMEGGATETEMEDRAEMENSSEGVEMTEQSEQMDGEMTDAQTGASGPGFGVLAALVALVAVALLARYRREQ